ncbi:MAG: DinB family protein [Anaerolineales bacterium]|nr:DinB family protein [Anaerolineales bacterium]
MNQTDLSTLIAYHFWANDRLLAMCERISADDFTRTVTLNPGWDSLREILVHMLDTEFGWRASLEGQDASEILDAANFPDVATLKARWAQERAAWRAFETQWTDTYLQTPHKPGRPTVAQTILHVINHGTQHRSEAAVILTGLGYSPGELDFYLFLRDAPPPPPITP